jgi:shikimate kinase
MKSKKIALIGMMGSGKTTIATLLAKEIDFEFIDSDKIFEDENNIKIKDYFEKFTEKSFRQKETQILKNIIKKDNIVISTGGGIILEKENREILFNSEILTIYLKTTPETIYQRIKNNKSRPLLLVDEPKKEIEKIIKNREEFYNLANITITTDNKTPKEITQELTEEIWKKF